MIIDFHTHAYPDKIADKGVQYIGDFYDLPMYGKGTIAHLKQVEREAGVTYTVVLGVAVRPDLVHSINNWLLSVLDDELIGFGTIHAAYEDNTGEIARFLAEGCRGVKIHPDMQEYFIDDPRLDPAYDYLSQVEVPLMVHLGDARDVYKRQLVRIAEMAGKPEMPLRKLDVMGIGKGFKFLPHGFGIAHL